MSPRRMDIMPSRVQRMYHIVYDLETRFHNMEEVRTYLDRMAYIHPYIPHTASVGENLTTARVCVAPTIEDCLNGISVSKRFRRCLAGWTGLTDYQNQDEVYPIIVCEVEGSSFYQPTRDEVDDVKWTHEYWTEEPVTVVKATLVWLGKESLQVYDSLEAGRLLCTHAVFVTDLKGMHHPWLDGQGHPLDCSDPGPSAWPRRKLAQQCLYYESFSGQQVVAVVPEFPYTGYCTCYPLAGERPYRARLHDCFRFTGAYDKDGEPIFDSDWIHVSDELGGGSVDCTDPFCIKVKLDNSDNVIWFSALDFRQVRSLEYRYLHEKPWFKTVF